jgi:hypothetical protein
MFLVWLKTVVRTMSTSVSQLHYSKLLMVADGSTHTIDVYAWAKDEFLMALGVWVGFEKKC